MSTPIPVPIASYLVGIATQLHSVLFKVNLYLYICPHMRPTLSVNGRASVECMLYVQAISLLYVEMLVYRRLRIPIVYTL